MITIRKFPTRGYARTEGRMVVIFLRGATQFSSAPLTMQPLGLTPFVTYSIVWVFTELWYVPSTVPHVSLSVAIKRRLFFFSFRKDITLEMELVGSEVLFMILKHNGGFMSWSLIQDGWTVLCTFQKWASQKVRAFKISRVSKKSQGFQTACRPLLAQT